MKAHGHPTAKNGTNLNKKSRRPSATFIKERFCLWNLNKFDKSYIEFYIPAFNRLLLTLTSLMSTLRLRRASHWRYCKTSLSSSQVYWLFSRRQRYFLPTTTDHLLRCFKGDKEVAIRLLLREQSDIAWKIARISPIPKTSEVFC